MTKNYIKSGSRGLLICLLIVFGCNHSKTEKQSEAGSFEKNQDVHRIDTTLKERTSYVRLAKDSEAFYKDPVITVFNSDSTKNRASFCYCQKTGEKGFKVQLYSAYSTQEDIDAGNDMIYNIIIERKKNEDFRAQFRFLNFEIQDGKLLDAYIVAKSTNAEYSGQNFRRTKIEQYQIDLSTFENHPLSNIAGSFAFQYAAGYGYFDWDNGVMGTFKCINQAPKSDEWIEDWDIEEWYYGH